MDSLEKIKEYIALEIDALRNIPIDDSILNAINLIYSQVHLKGGKVVVSGMGKAGQIGANIATTFCSTGTPAVFLHPSEAQHGDLGIVQPNDVMILISNSGKTREILELEYLVKELYPEMKIIGLSGKSDGEFLEFADVRLHTGGPKEICPLGLTPTTSTTVMTVLGDLLVVTLMNKIGFTKGDYSKRHHGGYLGVKAKQNG